MIIRFFRKDYLLQYITLLLLQLFFWLPALLFPELNYEKYSSFTSPGYIFIIWSVGHNPRILVVLAFILVFFSALVLNRTVAKHQLVTKNNMLTAFIYIVLLSHRPVYLSLNPALIANLFIIITLYQMFTLYMEKEAYSKIFNIGILLAIGSLFYFEVFFLLIFLWWTYNIYRIYFWREWIIPILGIITIYLFLGVYYFWTDQLNFALQQYQSLLHVFFSLDINFPQDYLSITINVAVYILTLFSVIVLISHLNEYIISVRKHYWASIILLITSVLILLISGNADSTNANILLIPMLKIFE